MKNPTRKIATVLMKPARHDLVRDVCMTVSVASHAVRVMLAVFVTTAGAALATSGLLDVAVDALLKARDFSFMAKKWPLIEESILWISIVTSVIAGIIGVWASVRGRK